MATVTIKLFIFSLVMRKPLNQPIATPNTNITAIATKALVCHPSPPCSGAAINRPATMAVNPIVDSDERSKLPVISVKDCPITNNPNAATRTKILTRLCGVKKLGESSEKTTSATSTNTQIRFSIKKRKRPFA